MATRSFICVELTEEYKKSFNITNCYMGVYCHFDGYIVGGVGETLLRHYNTYKKALRLIKHGSIRSLDKFIKDTEFFPKSKDEIFFFDDKDITPNFCEMICYIYIYRLNKGWIRYSSRGKKVWHNYGTLKDMKYFKQKFGNIK